MVSFSGASILDTQAQAYVFFLEHNFPVDKTLQRVADTYFPLLQQFLAQEEFVGKKGQLVSIPVAKGNETKLLIFAGIDKRTETTCNVEYYRRAVGTVTKLLQRKKLNSAAFQLPNPDALGSTFRYVAEQTTLIVEMALYAFDEFFSDKSAHVKKDINISLVSDGPAKEIEEGIKRGAIIGQAVNRVRHWIDMPPSLLTPVELANKAADIAKTYGLKITVFSEQEINKMGMGGLSAVSAGSELDCKLVIMEYRTAKKDAPTIAFVGKGITFDSGGLSIKPSEAMETMKEDMSGAAAVLGTMQALAQLKPDVNIIAATPLSENLPSGKAAKPGDIVTFYNGKTGEILNTDAEGRLILADALSYVVKHYKPDAIVDVATLTGLASMFFGPFYSSLFCNNATLAKKVQQAAHCAGERVWLLPYDEDYKEAVKSSVADIKNIGNKVIKSGTITAGWFLDHFVDGVPWAHLDIAGPSFQVPLSYYSVGATGVGVRLLVELAMDWNKK